MTLTQLLDVLEAVATADNWGRSTRSIASHLNGVTRQRLTPVLRSLEAEGFVSSNRVSGNFVYWRPTDAGLAVLRGYKRARDITAEKRAAERQSRLGV